MKGAVAVQLLSTHQKSKKLSWYLSVNGENTSVRDTKKFPFHLWITIVKPLSVFKKYKFYTWQGYVLGVWSLNDCPFLLKTLYIHVHVHVHNKTTLAQFTSGMILHVPLNCTYMYYLLHPKQIYSIKVTHVNHCTVDFYSLANYWKYLQTCTSFEGHLL